MAKRPIPLMFSEFEDNHQDNNEITKKKERAAVQHRYSKKCAKYRITATARDFTNTEMTSIGTLMIFLAKIIQATKRFQ
jgi:hypothetical protein